MTVSRAHRPILSIFIQPSYFPAVIPGQVGFWRRSPTEETLQIACVRFYRCPMPSCRRRSTKENKAHWTSCAWGRHNMPPSLQVDLWPFDIESGIRVTCDVGYLCANFSLSGSLCSRLRPDVRDRQTSDAHHRL